MKRGLTVGKFAPLHKGHQWLLEKALAEMDEMIVMIYDCPELTDIPLTLRANWLRALYPKLEIIEAWDGPTEVGNTPEIKKSMRTIFWDDCDRKKLAISTPVNFTGSI